VTGLGLSNLKFSLSLLPDTTPNRAAEFAKAAESNGFYGFSVADEIYHRDSWMTLTACALNTTRIRLGSAVTSVILRDPSLIAQAIGTLSQIAPGRTFCGLGVGNADMLAQYRHLQKISKSKPLARLEESVQIISALLRDGKIDYKGNYYGYNGVTSSSATGTQLPPLYVAGMGGPNTFRLAGRIGDGVMSAMGCSKEYHDYVRTNTEESAKGRGRPSHLPYSTWQIFCTANNSEAAKQAAKILVAFYLPAVPPRELSLHGITKEDIDPIRRALVQGDFELALKLTTEELVEDFSVSGSPSEIVEKLQKNFVQAGVDELLACIVDPEIIGSMMNRNIVDVPGYPENLELIKNKIIPQIDPDSN
jgi:5,10-methylenetetrahydromethanopterin reductase